MLKEHHRSMYTAECADALPYSRCPTQGLLMLIWCVQLTVQMLYTCLGLFVVPGVQGAYPSQQPCCSRCFRTLYSRTAALLSADLLERLKRIRMV
jgi:hypothetical protein